MFWLALVTSPRGTPRRAFCTCGCTSFFDLLKICDARCSTHQDQRKTIFVKATNSKNKNKGITLHSFLQLSLVVVWSKIDSAPFFWRFPTQKKVVSLKNSSNLKSCQSDQTLTLAQHKQVRNLMTTMTGNCKQMFKSLLNFWTLIDLFFSSPTCTWSFIHLQTLPSNLNLLLHPP